nr:MAG TPA: hypothetical protein [Caudoviricetes sp.]
MIIPYKTARCCLFACRNLKNLLTFWIHCI